MLGLGSNVGDRVENLRTALRLVDEVVETSVVETSSFYETEPRLFEEQPDFVNACAIAVTSLSPTALLDALLGVERTMGRERRIENGPRLIDLDLLFYGDEVVDTDRLTVPHPGVAERAFVLVPLSDIAADFVHPTEGRTVEQLCRDCPDTGWVRAITNSVA